MAVYHLYDGNNYIRRLAEKDTSGKLPRTVYNQMLLEATFPHEKRIPIMIWDGYRANARRREIYPLYKMGRVEPSESMFATFRFVEQILKFVPMTQIKLSGYEADDVIAELALHFSSRNHNVHIHSTDYDFQQLVDDRPSHIKCDARPKPEVPRFMVPYYKVTVGDSSDNIPGIPQFGIGSWNEIDKRKLEEYVDRAKLGIEIPEELSSIFPARCKPDPNDIKKYWEVVKFLNVDHNEIANATTIGQHNPEAAQSLLEKYML